jgi:hypothetical protein
MVTMFRMIGRLGWVAVGAIAIKAVEAYKDSRRELARVSRPTTSRRVHPKRVQRPHATRA